MNRRDQKHNYRRRQNILDWELHKFALNDSYIIMRNDNTDAGCL